MSIGLRIIPEDPALRRKALFVIPHPERRLPDGSPKEYHLRSDDNGTILVSVTVWQRIRQIMALNPFAPRFMLAGQTRNPPDLIIGGDPDTLPVERLEGDTLRPKGELVVVRQRLKG
jgi:hypothetical protein